MIDVITGVYRLKKPHLYSIDQAKNILFGKEFVASCRITVRVTTESSKKDYGGTPGRVAGGNLPLIPFNFLVILNSNTGRILFRPEMAVEEVFTRVQNRFSPDSEQRKDGPFLHRKYPD